MEIVQYMLPNDISEKNPLGKIANTSQIESFSNKSSIQLLLDDYCIRLFRSYTCSIQTYTLFMRRVHAYFHKIFYQARNRYTDALALALQDLWFSDSQLEEQRAAQNLRVLRKTPLTGNSRESPRKSLCFEKKISRTAGDEYLEVPRSRKICKKAKVLHPAFELVVFYLSNFSSPR